MMKQLTSYKTMTFADGDFRIDIVETRSEYSAWIYRKNGGLKSFMIGMPKKQQTFSETYTLTLSMFIDYVQMDLPEYKEWYDHDMDLYEDAMNADMESLPQPELDNRKRRSVIVRTEAGDVEYIIVEETLAYEWKVPYKLCDKAVEGHLICNTSPRFHEFETNKKIWKETTIENIHEVCERNEVLGEKVSV